MKAEKFEEMVLSHQVSMELKEIKEREECYLQILKRKHRGSYLYSRNVQYGWVAGSEA